MALFVAVMTGLLVACAIILVNLAAQQRSLHGNRRTQPSHRHRAVAGTSTFADLATAPVGASAPLPQGIAAGIAADPRAGNSPGLNPDAKAPDGIEPVWGWRAWGYNNGFLTSVNQSLIWPPGEAYKAECTKGIHGLEPDGSAHPAPEEGCTCGLYAAATEKQCQWPPSRSAVVVWGKVSGWGKVIEHNRGWKAQYAYPQSLLVWHEDSKTAGRAAALLRARYGCFVQVASGNQAMGAGVARAQPAMQIATTSGANAPSSVQQWAIQAQASANAAATTSQTAPAPQPNPGFQSFASHAAYQEFIAQQAKMALAKAQKDARDRAQKAAQNLLQLGLVLPESVGEELDLQEPEP